MTAAELDELLRQAAIHGEAVLFIPAKLVPKPGEHRRPMIELVPAPAEGAPITPYPDDA